MHPAAALDRVAYLLEVELASSYKVEAFRNAAVAISNFSETDLHSLCDSGGLDRIKGIGKTSGQIIREALDGIAPGYLSKLESQYRKPDERPGFGLLQQLKGDCHTHTNESDGGSPLRKMVETAVDLGHEYVVVTDHSPRLSIANGLSAERLERQIAEIQELQSEFPTCRILTGIEVDILDDGSLDQDEALLSQLDVVVASVHSKLQMDARFMTTRMIKALENPNMDILGHCTGRLGGGKKRPESRFDAEAVFKAAVDNNKAIEINSRPERLDPPMRLLELARDMGCSFSIDSDAHAPGQMEWLINGCDRAAQAGIQPCRIVNTSPVEELLEWTRLSR